MRTFVVTLLIVICWQYAYASPITAQTLRQLIEDSQYVVIARIDNPVQDVIELDSTNSEYIDLVNYDRDGMADLYIKEVLKGKPGNRKHLVVSYNAGVLCPMSPDFPDEKTVIAFLQKEKKRRTYVTHAESYGAKIMDTDSELEAYRTRIIEYLEILKITDENRRESATLEWLVKCSENYYTRWEGIFELTKTFVDGEIIYVGQEEPEPLFKRLSSKQMIRLIDTFFETDTLEYADLFFVDLISPDNYPELKNQLIKSMSVSDFFIVSNIMKKFIKIYPDQELQNIYEEINNLNFWDSEMLVRQSKLRDKFLLIATKL